MNVKVNLSKAEVEQFLPAEEPEEAGNVELFGQKEDEIHQKETAMEHQIQRVVKTP